METYREREREGWIDRCRDEWRKRVKETEDVKSVDRKICEEER